MMSIVLFALMFRLLKRLYRISIQAIGSLRNQSAELTYTNMLAPVLFCSLSGMSVAGIFVAHLLYKPLYILIGFAINCIHYNYQRQLNTDLGAAVQPN